VSVDFQQLRELLSAIANTDITELTLKSDDFELQVKKGSQLSSAESRPILPTTETKSAPEPTITSAPDSIADTSGSKAQPQWLEVTSPMVGTFYRSPAPDEPPFVNTGERINKGDTVCIIEAMKLMNDIEAEVAGEVVEILVENGEPVEYGQVLMRVKP
jgi:acetyl-CoA carboxylase biotin carboxyl carrier protein